MMMKLKDLETEMVIITKAGYRYMVLKMRNGLRFVNTEGTFDDWYGFNSCDGMYDEDLTASDDCYTIMRIYRAVDGVGNKVNEDYYSCIWKRPQPREMTVKQISERLGYPVKVVG